MVVLYSRFYSWAFMQSQISRVFLVVTLCKSRFRWAFTSVMKVNKATDESGIVSYLNSYLNTGQ